MEQTLTYPDRPLQVGDLVMYSFLLDTQPHEFADTNLVFTITHEGQVMERLKDVRTGKERLISFLRYTVQRIDTGKVTTEIAPANITHISHQQSEQLRGLKIGRELNIM